MTKMVMNNIKQKKWPGGTGGKEGKLGWGAALKGLVFKQFSLK